MVMGHATPHAHTQVLRTLPAFQDQTPGAAPFTMPVSTEGKRVHYKLVEYSPLIDSSNVTVSSWRTIARDIGAAYGEYDGFVVVHGTDTMAFTASALSFMLRGLGKPVVLTGGQIPLCMQRNDSASNLLGAMIVASHYAIPEVTLYFANKLLRGNRSTKLDAGGLDAFASGNYPPLVTAGVRLSVAWELVLPATTETFEVDDRYDERVAVLSLFPGITNEIVRAVVQPPVRGLILRTYGSGNAPDNNPEFLAILRAATERGVVILNITQCHKGAVAADYATGRALAAAGAVSGGDMTFEAALAKLGHLLGRALSPEEARREVGASLRGECTVVRDTTFSLLSRSFVASVYRAIAPGATSTSRAAQDMLAITDVLAPVLMCAAAGVGDLDQVSTWWCTVE